MFECLCLEIIRIFSFLLISSFFLTSKNSPENALAIARAGVEYMHNNFEFIEPGTNNKSSFAQYMANASSKGSYETGIIEGTGLKGGKPLVVPYKGAELTGPSLKKLVFLFLSFSFLIF